MTLTHENLKEHLEKIGYKIKGTKPNSFIFNHKGKNTGIRVWQDTLEVNGEEGIRCIFSFGKATIEMIEKSAVSIGSEGGFFNLYNFDNIKQQNNQ